ncbi:bacteriohemerythrin [Magnetococcus sp. PR-3]|uniref:bacteriohemerythrin n=1 Tax=Magnetococcus sp. PR-3 TaxID=3120355 RepID=UPI002FCDF4FC
MTQPTGLVRTGIEPIDRDHLHLWDLFQTLLEKELRSDEAQAIIEELLAYTRYHFEREERLMEDIAFPPQLRQAHEQEHQSFVQRVESFMEILRQGKSRQTSGMDTLVQEIQQNYNQPQLPNLDPPKQVVAFLVEWILNHTSGMDIELATYTETKKGHLADQDFSFLES